MPAGVQCTISSSHGEFPSYWDWLWCPGLSPVLVWRCPSPFPSLSILGVFHSLLSAIGFQTCFFFTADISPPIRSTLHLHTFRWVSRLGTGSGPRCFCPRGGQRCAWSRKLDPNFCSGRGRTSDLGIRLPRTSLFSRLLRHAGGYSRTILTPNLQYGFNV